MSPHRNWALHQWAKGDLVWTLAYGAWRRGMVVRVMRTRVMVGLIMPGGVREKPISAAQLRPCNGHEHPREEWWWVDDPNYVEPRYGAR